MKLEVGKTYHTREGNRVDVLRKLKAPMFCYLGVMYLADHDIEIAEYWAEDGRISSQVGHPQDLTAEAFVPIGSLEQDEDYRVAPDPLQPGLFEEHA